MIKTEKKKKKKADLTRIKQIINQMKLSLKKQKKIFLRK